MKLIRSNGRETLLNQEKLAILSRQLSTLEASFSLLPDYEESETLAPMESVLSELSSRMADHYPYFSVRLVVVLAGSSPFSVSTTDNYSDNYYDNK
ncbi:Uncharacterised protein [Serratia plymuthica]|nr:Uncharacterised protein [Serratia plymuthica]